MVDISVIIPAYNDAAGVMTCLNSLQALGTMPPGRVEYLVQDDASPDVIYTAIVPASIALTQRNVANVGFGANCNAGAARAKGQVLFFVNQDAYAVYGFSEGWDRHLLDTFILDSKAGIVGPRLLFPDGKLQSAGGLFDGRCQPYHRCIGYERLEDPEISTPRDIPWVTGAAFGIRRELWQELGGFDLAYERGYFEDVDLCVRCWRAGWHVRYEPSITLIHKPGSTGGSPYFYKNAQTFKRKWVDTGMIEPDGSGVYERFWI